MPTLNTEAVLSGAAEDVLHALFFRGALPSGDLPSKAGAQELREIGLAETRTTEYKYHGEDYFTWLTQKGQQVAIERIGGKNPQCHVTTMKLEIDTGDVEKVFEEAIEEIRDLNNSTPEDTLHEILVATLPSTPTIELRARAEELAVAIKSAYAKLEDKLEDKPEASSEFKVCTEMHVSPLTLSDEFSDLISKITSETIKRESRPGGMLHR